MPPILTIIKWRDIPAQVTAKDGPRVVRRELHRRFQVAIDRAAMKAGRHEASAYIEEWVSERRPCGEDLEAEVAALADALEASHDRVALNRLVDQGGWADPAAHPADDPDGAGTADDPDEAEAAGRDGGAA